MDSYAKLIEDDVVHSEPKYKIGDKFVDKITGKDHSHTYYTITQIYLSELVEDAFLYDLKMSHMNGTFCGCCWHKVSEDRINNRMIKLED